MDAQNEHSSPDHYSSQPNEPQPLQDVSRHDENSPQYTLTVEEASKLFARAGVPRSPRSVVRFCAHNHLDCIKVDTERNEKYLISESSVEERIEELKQVMAASHVLPHPDMSGHDGTYPDMSGHDATSRDTSQSDEHTKELESRVGELEEENEKLKNQNLDLRILNRGKDMVLKEAKKTIWRSEERLLRFSRAVGDLAAKLRLKAPDVDADTSQIIAYLDAPIPDPEPEDENFVDSPDRQMR